MNKIAENKTRKKLRITLCVLYLFEIVLCTMPYFQYSTPDHILHSYSVFDVMSLWGSNVFGSAQSISAAHFSLFVPVLVIIPVVGFFFCALDKQRNLKNIASLICCLLGVISILTMVSYTISLGSTLALLLYLLICFLTTISIFARYSKSPDEENK